MPQNSAIKLMMTQNVHFIYYTITTITNTTNIFLKTMQIDVVLHTCFHTYYIMAQLLIFVVVVMLSKTFIDLVTVKLTDVVQLIV